MTEAALAALLGLGTGIALGLAARIGEFCTLGAIESAAYAGDQRRARLWGIVLGTAIIATYALAAAGQIDLSATLYHRVAWNPWASVIGGLIFGYGMAYAGNCGFGALARLGGGDLRSLVVVIVIGISGFMTLSGPLAMARLRLFPTQPADTFQGLAHAVPGIPPVVIALGVGIVLICLALAHGPLRERPKQIAWGVVAGLAFAAAFWGTSHLHEQSFGEIPVEGHTFTAPIGRSILFLMTSSGGGLGFAVGSVFGVIAGAFLGSRIKGLFRWEACEDPRELGRQVFGAMLMGIGGVIALGCSVGQGVSAVATLAWSGPVTLAAIIIGTLLGLRHLISGFQPG